MQRLRDAVKEADHNSQKIKDEFLRGDMKRTEFVRRFVKQRVLAHERNIKLTQYQAELRRSATLSI